jgi:hypothetical protein
MEEYQFVGIFLVDDEQFGKKLIRIKKTGLNRYCDRKNTLIPCKL